MILEDGDVKLTLTNDRSYFYKLAKENKYTQGKVKNIILSIPYIKYLWVGEYQGIRGGVIYLSELPIFWTMDAYKEDKLLKELNPQGDFSYRAGKLVSDWYFKNIGKTLRVAPNTINRGAILVAKRLGFEFETTIEDFTILKRDA